MAHALLLTAVFEIEKTNAKTVDLAGTTVLAGNQTSPAAAERHESGE